jgi:hypothetical protein
MLGFTISVVNRHSCQYINLNKKYLSIFALVEMVDIMYGTYNRLGYRMTLYANMYQHATCTRKLNGDLK